MTALHTQDFLRSGKSLTNLYQRYDIQHFICPEFGIVVFNYRPLSPKSSPIVRECRGLVLAMDTWDVVCKPINAFFEPSEAGYKAVYEQFDWSTAKAMNKIDGALVCMYYYKGAWHISTRFSADGSAVVNSPNTSGRSVTWRQLVEETLESHGTTWKDYTQKLDKDIFYVFELVTPDNRVIVLYSKPHLYLVAAIGRLDLREIDIESLTFSGELVPYKPVKSLAEVYAMIEAKPDAYKNEGYVVVDGHFNRLKIRNPRYAEAMRVYSVNDELSALRELRMLDVSGFTIMTDPIETDPTGGTGTGGGGTGTGGTGTGGVGSNTGEVPEELQFLGPMSAPPSLRNVLNRVLFMARFISDTYAEALESGQPIESHANYDVWPQAYQAMKNGSSISDVMDQSSDLELMAALRRYETQFAGM